MQKSGDEALFAEAAAMRGRAYAPYSGFLVGAALLAKGGRVFLGCNVENAAFSPSNCAERTALFAAVAAGERQFSAIAIAGGKAGEPGSAPCLPCGVCLQALLEFCDPQSFRVLTANGEGGLQAFLLGELLPHGFRL
ncbi:MAG: cytidine deaminase [Christensenellaceae bacterium]|jgi:cytidine deaminase|nr:cytidine deaminase [Christensenellaceae bacterium]